MITPSLTIFDELRSLNGRGTELITLYVPYNKISDAQRLLRDELGKATNIKSRVTRLSVTSAIKSVQERLKQINTDSVILVGDTSSGWISRNINTPKAINSLIYKCGDTFFLDPLISMVPKGPLYAIICLDLHEMILATLQGTSINVVVEDESQVPSKMSRGGQSAKRFEKNRNLAIITWFKKCAEALTETLLPLEISGLIISGPGLTKNDFELSGYLHHELRKKVLGVIDTGYTGIQGLKETINNSELLLSDLELVKQRKLVSQFLTRLARDDTRIAYGKASVIKNIQKTSILLLSNENKSLQILADSFGVSVYIISDTFEEGAQLKSVFGGYAAILRY